MRWYIPVLLFAVSSMPVVSSAQFENLGDPGSAFSVSMAPEFPQPNSQVTLSFVSSSIDLNNATLTVLSNGKQVHQGSVQAVSVPVGGAGTITRILATVTAQGTLYEQSLSIQPQDVVLVAEPIASVPPLYPGKPVTPLEGSVRVVAIAGFKNAAGASLDPLMLSYAWVVDDTRVANSSGIGKRVMSVSSPLQYRSRTVSVLITSSDGTLRSGASLSLAPLEPHVRVYESDPLLGIRFERALSEEFSISGAETTFYAAPFSFSTKNGPPRLQWFLNSEAVQAGNTITLRPTGTGSGKASLSVVASAGEYTTATLNLPILFGSGNSSFFGL